MTENSFKEYYAEYMKKRSGQRSKEISTFITDDGFIITVEENKTTKKTN